MSAPTSFVIERSKWLRGQGAQASRLKRKDDGMMCCLGQVALQCGIPAHAILDVEAPKRTRAAEPFVYMWPEWFYGKVFRHDEIDEAMDINDGPHLSDADRERRLTAIFKEHGYTLTFID